MSKYFDDAEVKVNQTEWMEAPNWAVESVDQLAGLEVSSLGTPGPRGA